MSNDDHHYMQRALQLAALGLGRTSPNPVVGAVIVKNGIIVGEGYHQKAGTPHAEIHALRQAGEQARGADIYVTLEPCSHYGRTPPCVNALIEAGIKRVVAAVLDPNPLVAGQGIEILNNAGIETKVGVLEEPARRLNEAFFKFITTNRPFVALKTAITLDGKIATRKGNSRWITSPEARRYVHQLRNRYDAIMAGIGTVLADDPMLNTRLDDPTARDPVRIIVDGQLDLPLDSQIANTSRKQTTLVYTSRNADRGREKALKQKGLEVIRIDGTQNNLDLSQVMDDLGKRGMISVLVEGGAGLNASLLEQKLVDKLYWFIAPKIIGGSQAPGPVGGSGAASMDEAILLHDIQQQQIGDDLLIEAYTRW
ncbi:MAG TPA: bifunctional diaminohydroxyphosphoribosylaminopyrimidine deaminase/5-amino-6-(5-phosphoribosylamino)uracil reductase RibD [Syntrophomonadaceae bacterium]|nr:bifunctional diaminohydroxyphosphoribosylaminopyrimidine deaminase/5-amino-6-(5-phosphoribosylamino)uracil reductase RibD [Syntrophomonadaceae bacterium]HQE22542.1 bifunctional diaminohydroxyphosphoribosylaminopyrimidine deaminase/5-amino-6-(5-phosphoribosylamino)uracil reductase RibD [Syntrophomonadaceae bacterium]